MPALILAMGAAAAFLWITTTAVRERLLLQNRARIRAVREIRLAVATSHLWLEERLTGDRVDPRTIWSSLDEAHDLALGVLRGGQVGPEPTTRLEPLDEPAMRLRGERLRGWIDRLRDLARQRLEGYRAGVDTGVGSPVDADYDRLFHLASAESEALERQLEARRQRDESRANGVFLGLLLLWLALVAVAAWGLWHRERRRRQAEEALNKSQEQLLQAHKMEAVGRLAGGLAHDINNYVTAITSHCELVKMQARPGERIVEKMDLVIATANRISLLVRRLLAFSKQQPVQPRVVDLNEVVQGLDTMIRGLLGEDLQLEAYLANDLWKVKVDPSQVEQILVNLLVNAREASPRGGQVTVETANYRLGQDPVEGGAALPAGDYVVIAVSDTGGGIDPEIRDKIFEPFFSTKEEGNGLGLATVYGIVQQNGGQVSVYSEAGHGTTFRVYLPRSTEPAATPAPAPASGAPRGEGETILLIEDNAELRQATQGILQALGYRVAPASGGEEALTLLERAGGVDLVVSDVVMPGLSGKEVADRIRIRHPDQRVLFISGYTDNVVLRHGILEGDVDFLEKPFSAERLAAKIRDVLARPRPAPANL